MNFWFLRKKGLNFLKKHSRFSFKQPQFPVQHFRWNDIFFISSTEYSFELHNNCNAKTLELEGNNFRNPLCKTQLHRPVRFKVHSSAPIPQHSKFPDILSMRACKSLKRDSIFFSHVVHFPKPKCGSIEY